MDDKLAEEYIHIAKTKISVLKYGGQDYYLLPDLVKLLYASASSSTAPVAKQTFELLAKDLEKYR